jgi:hypothetical protein
VTLLVGTRPLAAELTDKELEKVKDVLDEAVEAARSGEYSRIKLRDALRTAIGNDPFTTAPRKSVRNEAGIVPLWLGIIFVFFGLGFAIGNDNIWLQIAGCAFAMIALADVVWHGISSLRSRRVN